MGSVTRAFSLRPYVCFDKGTGVGLDLYNVLEEVRLDAELCASEAIKHITVNNLGKLSEHDRLKPAVAGLRMGMRFSVTGRSTGRSRFERMVCEYAVSQLRSWRERQRVYVRKSDKYVSAGYKHTVRQSKPSSLKPRLALSVTDKQYHAIRRTGSSIELDMVVNGRWVTFKFKTPDRFLEEGVRIIAPTVTVNEKDRVVFNWYVELPVERSEFSSRYVIGVDVGITNHTTAVVRDITTGQVIETSFMNRRVRSLENKIKRTKTQITALHSKGRVGEVEAHRKALSNRRKELAVLIGQEIADMSWEYGNALVSVEDLSHIKNTMKNGRWVRGLIIKRITDMVESNGGRVMTVPAAYTSRKCHRCGTMLDMTDYHHPVCATCRVSWDRDENAAANIAEKLKDKERHKKACQTRKKHASQKLRRNSKGSLHPLKHPLKKTIPTPKAPQNQPKNRDNHMIHHTQRVVHNREGVFPILCAADWSLCHGNVSVPAVASTLGDRCSDNKPHDYPKRRSRPDDLRLH
jgi:Transposase and inactivated derivatives